MARAVEGEKEEEKEEEEEIEEVEVEEEEEEEEEEGEKPGSLLPTPLSLPWLVVADRHIKAV